jgi:hypothetical protein
VGDKHERDYNSDLSEDELADDGYNERLEKLGTNMEFKDFQK